MAVAVELVMPRLSESMEEGTIVSWLVGDGSPVQRGQEIAEIETDKATLPYEAPEGGVLRILVPEGTTLPLGSPIGLIDDFAGVPAPVAAPAGAAPAAADVDPPTESFEVPPGLLSAQGVPEGAPQPVASASGGQEWSPAWGPQQPHPAQGPGGAQPQRPTPPVPPIPPIPPQPPAASAPPATAGHPSDEGETTEFDAIDPSVFAEREPAPPAPAAPTPAVPQASPPATPAPPVQPALADPSGNPWVGAPTPVGGVPVPPAPTEPAPAAPVPAAPAPAADAAPPADAAPASPPPAAPEAPVADAPAEEGRYAADELIAPPTLAPRPPEQQPAPAAGSPRVIASPVARRLAGELGIDLSTLTGSGPEGRIVRADIEAAQAEGAARPPRPASAAPTAASEFTPPVDETRAAAPIPTPDPAPEPAAEVAAAPDPAAETEPQAMAAPVSEPDAAVAAEPAPEADAATPAAEEGAPTPAHDASDVAEADLEAEAEAQVAEVVALAADEARSIDADDEADVDLDQAAASESAVEDAAPASAEPEPEPAAAGEARVLPAAQPGGGKGEPEIVELTRQQATVARRMAESKATIPDFHTTVELDATPLLTLRADLLATRPDLAAPSVNDLLVKAVAIALRAFPRLNGAYKDGRIELYPRINVGISMESAGALVVPVIHDADKLSVAQIAARTDEILEKAGSGGLRPPDVASATFTVSNLGMHGVDEFTAVITPGQAAVLTAGAIAERPVIRNGAVVAGQTLRLTLTTDHRAIYGLQAAEFLGRVRQLIEHPSSLLA